VTMRMPTLLPFGEGCMSGEAIDTRTRSIRRGSGHGTSERWFVVIGGDPSLARVAASTSRQAVATAGVGQGRWSVHAEHVSDMTRPGNAGGAKDPDFWCAFEDGEVKVIGDEPCNT
jgi:hypothetical protein